jgi:predicted O-methyltransferase YrrM
MEYIKDKFSKYTGVNVIKGSVPQVLDTIDKKYDYVYIDLSNDRRLIRDTLNKVKDMIKPGGIIGLNDYLIYDGIIEDAPYGTYQSVNEFLFLNKEWSVDAIALHTLGFYDIYLRSKVEYQK